MGIEEIKIVVLIWNVIMINILLYIGYIFQPRILNKERERERVYINIIYITELKYYQVLQILHADIVDMFLQIITFNLPRSWGNMIKKITYDDVTM